MHLLKCFEKNNDLKIFTFPKHTASGLQRMNHFIYAMYKM